MGLLLLNTLTSHFSSFLHFENIVFKMLENVFINGEVLPMPGDGSCLFYCLSHCIYDTKILGDEVRLEVVSYDVFHWL